MDVKAPDEERYLFGPFVLNPAQRELLRDGVPLPLTYRLFETLLVFVRNPGRILTKDELLESIWPGRYMEESSLKQAIFELRKALGDNDETQFIATAPARGYTFVAPVERIGASVSLPVAQIEQSAAVIPVAAGSNNLGRHRKSFVAAVAAAAALTILFAGSLTLDWRNGSPPAPAKTRTVVLSDFQNLTNDPALSVVLGKVLQIDLAQSPYLNLLSQQQIGETLQRMERAKDAPLTPALAQEVCVRNRGDAILSGTVARTGAAFFVTLEAKDCGRGDTIVAVKASVGREEDLPGALDGLTLKAREGLQESDSSIRQFEVPIAQATTSSFAALKAYSLGERLRVHGDNAGAVQFFKNAVEFDRSFALAYAELANSYFGMREIETGKAIYKKAFELRDRTTENERLGIAANYYAWLGNYVEAERAFRVLVRTYPDYWAPWSNLGNLLTNMARYDEAIAAARQALRLNPHHYGPYVVLARAYKRATRFADAKAVAALAIRNGFDNWDFHGLLYEIAYAEGDARTMAAEVAKEKGQTTEAIMLDYEALAVAASGQLRRSEDLFGKAIALARSQGPDSLEDVANFYGDEIETAAVLGSPQEALRVSGGATDAEKARFDDFAIASFGDYQNSSNAARAAAARNPESTEDCEIELPLTLAEIDLAQNRPADAIAALQPAVPYELRDFWAPYLLGRAYLGTGTAEKAAIEFRRVLSNRGVDGTSPLFPYAWLGLARALHMQHRNAESRAAYEKLFAFWKNADSDLPVLVAAKKEYAGL